MSTTERRSSSLPSNAPDRPDVGEIDGAEIRAEDRAHVFHSWSAQAAINPTPIVAAQGCWFWDDEGNRYFDLAAQLVNVNLGHRHPDLVAAIQSQADRLLMVAPSFANDMRSRLARMVVERAPENMAKVFFTNGGADANEHAVRMARQHTGRTKILTAYHSYHGGSDLTMAMTMEPRGWMLDESPGFVHFFRPHLYRSVFESDDWEEECERALAHLEAVILGEGPHTIAAVAFETVVGTNGALAPPDGYLEGVRELCDAHGILLIVDEVMVGFGRVGEWFAIQRWDVHPDLITFAKGVNSGSVPLGGVVMSHEVAATFDDRPYPGGLTYSGHPLACAAGVATIEVMERDDVLDHVRAIEPWLEEEIAGLAERHDSVGDIRGLGMFWAVELVTDASTREPLVPLVHGLQPPMTEVVAACRDRGVWPFAHQNRIQFAPPLVATRRELAWVIDVVDEALDVADRHAAAH